MTAALILFAFTMGLVLSPVVGKAIRNIHKRHTYNKEQAAIALLEGYGYTVTFSSSLSDDTIVDKDPWL